MLALSEESVIALMNIHQSNTDFESQVVSNEEGAQAIFQAVLKGRIPELCHSEGARKAVKNYLDIVKLIRDLHEHHFGEKDNSPVEDLIKHAFIRLTEETCQRMKLQKDLKPSTFFPKHRVP